MSDRLLRTVCAIELAACVACSTQEPVVDTSSLPKIGVEFQLTEDDICLRGSQSPEIRLTGLPTGVVSFDMRMTDFESPHYRHWNEAITYQGSTIPAGQATSYRGPGCPPNGHRYRISVLAKDARQQPIAHGEKTIVAARTR